jgi:hypothetical protein
VLFLAGLVWRVADPAARRRDYAVLAAVGACLVWVAHPVPLVAAGLGTAVIVGHARAGRWREAGLMVATAGCWLASFAALYLLAVRHIHANGFLVAYWQLGFPPVGRGVTGFTSWAGRVLTDAFIIPGRISPVQLGLALAVAGAARLARDPVRFGFVVLPVAVVFGAAVARVFPFQNRLLLFLVPFLLWLIAAGLDGLLGSRWRAVRLAGWACLAVLVWHPLLELKGGLLKPTRHEESREVLAYVSSRAEPGDVLYVHPNARHTFEYYRGRLDLGALEVVHGPVVPPAVAVRHFGEVPAARRVWVFHSEMRSGASPVVPLTRDEVLTVAAVGRPALDRRDAPGVCVALFGPVRPVGE